MASLSILQTQIQLNFPVARSCSHRAKGKDGGAGNTEDGGLCKDEDGSFGNAEGGGVGNMVTKAVDNAEKERKQCLIHHSSFILSHFSTGLVT